MQLLLSVGVSNRRRNGESVSAFVGTVSEKLSYQHNIKSCRLTLLIVTLFFSSQGMRRSTEYEDRLQIRENMKALGDFLVSFRINSQFMSNPIIQ